MKRTLFIASIVLALFMTAGGILAQQQGNNQGYSPQGQGWFCPWCGQQYGQGQGMGPGMMHRGQGMRQGMGQGSHGKGMRNRWHGQGMRNGMSQGGDHGRISGGKIADR